MVMWTTDLFQRVQILAGEAISMPTQIKDSQPVTDAYIDQEPPPVHDAVDPTTEQPSSAANPTLRLQDLRVQLVRQGVDLSLRALQVWADLGRQRELPALDSSASATYDLFKKLLAAQREVVNELVATQRHLAHGYLATTPTVGDGLACP